VVVSEVVVESPLLLHDHMVAAERQMAKESNLLFIKWFLWDECQKSYAKCLLIFCLRKVIVNNGF
jgi:hypothetical protein